MNARTEAFMLHLHTAVEILPDVEDLEEWRQESNRQDAVGPVLYPDAWGRGRRRLDALRQVVSAALELRRAWEELQEVAEEEADPEQDQAQLDALEAFLRHHRGTP